MQFCNQRQWVVTEGEMIAIAVRTPRSKLIDHLCKSTSRVTGFFRHLAMLSSGKCVCFSMGETREKVTGDKVSQQKGTHGWRMTTTNDISVRHPRRQQKKHSATSFVVQHTDEA